MGNPLIVLQEEDEEDQEAEAGADPAAGAAGAEKDGEAADEGDDPWQSAWDAFEVARVIFDKAGPDYRMKVAFCLEYLGDISLEKGPLSSPQLFSLETDRNCRGIHGS